MNTTTIFGILLSAWIIWILFKKFIPMKGLEELKDKDFRDMLQQSSRKLLVDVREPNEYQIGHIVDAVNIPLSLINSRIKELPKDKEIYLYCQSGMRSKRAAGLLLKNGFSKVSHLQGGFLTWTGKRAK